MNRFLRIREVCAQLGLSRSTVYRLVNVGSFPQPVRISKKSKAWLESDVADYQKERITASRGKHTSS